VNFRVFVQKEFGKHNKQNKTTAKSVGHGIANSITDKEVEQIEQLEAHALFVAKLANSMQEQSHKQFKEMMELFKAKLDAKTSPNPSYPKRGEGKKKKKCPHCGMEVYHKPEACFELEANTSKRPAGWKSKKSTWSGAEVKSTEQWQPGEVDITKLKKQFFPYLVGLDPPPYNELALPVADSGPRPIATFA